MSKGNNGPTVFRRRLREMPPGPIVTSEPLGCIKIGYESENEARCSGHSGRAYKCRRCQRWHITTQRR